MPIRNSMRLSGATPALRSTIALCTSMAQLTASTTLRNSTIAAVAGALDDAPVMGGDSRDRSDRCAAPAAAQAAVLVGPGKPRIADHVGHQDRGDFAGFAHGATPPRPCQPFRVVRAKPLGGIAKTREECRSWACSWRSRFSASVRGKRGKPGPRSPTCRELTYPAPMGSLASDGASRKAIPAAHRRPWGRN